jgi:hypothetical protein
MGVWIQYQNKSTIVAEGGKIFPATEKSMSESIKCEGVVDLFFYYYWKGVVHHEFVPRGQTANGQFYLEVTQRLREAVRRKRPEGWRNKPWMLHNDKVPAHASLLIREFLEKHETTLVPQPPHSPDLAPADFSFVPEVEIHSERSPISEDRRDRRNFATGPTRYPAKRVPELEKNVGSGV